MLEGLSSLATDRWFSKIGSLITRAQIAEVHNF